MLWRALLAVIALTALVSGCCTDPVNGERYFCLGEMSDAQEVEIGRSAAPEFIAESGGVYPDAEFNAYLEGIVLGKLVPVSHRPSLPWEFTVLNTSAINAFALPGGEVFVTRGLLARLESEAQFAHLMGHEIGHVSHRHAVRGMNRGALLQILVQSASIAEQAALDPDQPQILTPAVGIAGGLLLLRYSRDQELQSDRRGIDYAIRAGYDPREATRTFEMFLELKRRSGREESLIENLLATHPLDSTRIDEIERYTAEAHGDVPAGLVVTGGEWDRHLQSIRSAQRVYDRYDEALALIERARDEDDAALLDRAEELLRGCARDLPRHAPFPDGLALVHLEREDLAAAARELDRACALDPGYFPAQLHRGLVLHRRGEDATARASLERAHELHRSHPMPCYLLGEVEESAGDREAARTWYERAAALAPPDSELARRSRERAEALR